MGTVVSLPRPSKTKVRSKRPENAKPAGGAKILFFSGVRYSRYFEAAAKFSAKRD